MRKLTIASLLALSCTTLLAQSNTDTATNAAYKHRIETSGDLFYGIEHMVYTQQMNGTPYFESSEWQKGSVTYNNVLHEDVMLRYDLLKDELIALHPNGFFPVTVISERVQSFTIGNQQFVFIPEINAAGLSRGFYHVLVDGKLSILVKRSKVIEEKTSVHGVERNVIAKNQYYTLKNGAASTVTGEESVIQLLGEHARAVRTHLRSRNLKFRKQKEIALFEIATYYNQLSR